MPKIHQTDFEMHVKYSRARLRNRANNLPTETDPKVMPKLQQTDSEMIQELHKTDPENDAKCSPDRP